MDNKAHVEMDIRAYVRNWRTDETSDGFKVGALF